MDENYDYRWMDADLTTEQKWAPVDRIVNRLNERKAQAQTFKRVKKVREQGPKLVDPAMARRLFDEAEAEYKRATGQDDLSEEDHALVEGLEINVSSNWI